MSNMTREETINVLQSIEDRATDFPYMTACDWVAIAAAKRHLENSLEAEEADSYNNGWIDCAKQMPPEQKQYSDTLQGHREWTESDLVLAWDSLYGCRVDATKNGKWMSEQRGGYTGQVVHGIIAWRPIPEFNEELL
jgi:hypothetical protein